MTSLLQANSNEERTFDRDLDHSQLMRKPGTYPDNHKIRRPGFGDIRSFDRDVSIVCNICGLEAFVWNVSRKIPNTQGTRYTLNLASKLGVHAFQVGKETYIYGGKPVFLADIRDLITGDRWVYTSSVEFVQWVEQQYWNHLFEKHGETKTIPSRYGAK